MVRGPRGCLTCVHNARGGGFSRRGNGIGDAGAQAIAAALRESALTSLDLECVRVECARVISRVKNDAWGGWVMCVRGERTARMSHMCA